MLYDTTAALHPMVVDGRMQMLTAISTGLRNILVISLVVGGALLVYSRKFK